MILKMLTESILIALVGASRGVPGAIGGVRALVALLLPDFARAHGIHVDATVFGFTFAIALAAGMLFGLAPDRPNTANPSSRDQNYCDQLLFLGSLEVDFLGQISSIPTAIRIPAG
jgi:hypothetical protein